MSSLSEIRRLGKNLSGYFGDTIDIAGVIAEALAAAREHGWQLTSLECGPGLSLPALHRPAKTPGGRRVYISTGIHGDEPAGPLAARQMLIENQWPADADLWLCPCLNPTGFPLNRRENAAGIDLNRDFRDSQTLEIQAQVRWLLAQPSFDLTLCLHEDWEAHGFYLYELNPHHLPTLAEKMIAAVAPVCPIDQSALIDGREAIAGIIRPDLDPSLRPQWPEAFFLIQQKTKLSYTLESPSDFPLPIRVTALVTATRAALNSRAV